MAATWSIPQRDLCSVFENISDGILIVSPAAEILYRNAALEGFPTHLEERVLSLCATQHCCCGADDDLQLVERAMMEGWGVSCYALGENRLIIVKYDDYLGERIQSLRDDFAKQIASGILPSIAAMQVLRDRIASRWITIGRMDWPNERIIFDLCYDHDRLRQDGIPPLYRNVGFNMCGSMVVTKNLTGFFNQTEPHTDMGVAHIVGLALKNHRNECIGYALIADDHEPENLKETVTFLQELAVLYGPYFEVGSAEKKTRKAVADAHTDVVTGQGNRRAFESFMHECLEDMRNELEESEVEAMFDPKSLRNSLMMLIDFDGFKRVNDLAGHDEGDRALRLVAEALCEINSDSRVYRIGGDELVQVFPRAGDLEADDLRQHINIIEREMSGHGFDDIGLSMGVVHFFEGEGSFASLMALADARMYQDKRMRSIAFV
ncbi:GGDEF domain-containing protein [Cohaesibacter celericrescens]|uniref:diguanylate cyclase n=1 Tax=Cohaesibacter celericrescens TaxID=2067669 RepID=A0A2N5XKJ1_9HYPH|nr:GGDEF domain-containing protein [Cohaesibacter celericrescens]PLW75004.1 hypothetical protein C0081_22140 [Cohaesibacter celericrescens]